MNKIKSCGDMLEIHSHINEKAIQLIEKLAENNLERIQFDYDSVEPNENDIKVLNSYFRNHKEISFRWTENWMIPFLPDLEKFYFISSYFNEESIDLLKKNKVTALSIEYSPDKKFDLMKLIGFKDTLEELSLEGNYKNLEHFINETKKLKKLTLTSLKIDFDKIDENVIEEFNYYGLKTINWLEIAKLSRLKNLGIHTNNTLENLDFLSELKNLEILELSYCSKVKAFPDLTCLKNLKHINGIVLNGLENIDELKRLEKVEIQVHGKKLPKPYYSTG